MSQERLRVHYVGRVQGVGFRYTTARLAPGFGVSGFVRNVHDGSVELEAQGDPARLQEFLSAIRDAFGSKIYRADNSTVPIDYQEPPGQFLIHYE